MSNKKHGLFKKRRLRVRNRIKKFSKDKVRMSIHRSSKNLYVQLIDDSVGKTILQPLLEKKPLAKILEMTLRLRQLLVKR